MRTARYRSRAGGVAAALAGAGMLGAMAGCSFSESAVSPSKSVSASSESSSADHEDAYRQEVRDYTAAYVQSGGQDDSFERTLADLGRKHGISDWQSNSNTWVGVGQGLARAGVTGEAYDTYKANLAGGHLARMQGIERGYGSARR